MSANRLQCSMCGDAIGTYEPIVEVAWPLARETSMLNLRAEGKPRKANDYYHRDYYPSTGPRLSQA